MVKPVINTGRDYLFSQVHGMWGSCIHGQRLANLTGAVTEDAFLRNVQTLGLRNGIGFNRGIFERQAQLLYSVMQRLTGREYEYYKVCLERLKRENLRTVLHARYVRKSSDGLENLFLELPEERKNTYVAAVNCKNDEEFIQMLGLAEDDDAVKIIRALSAEGDIMQAECQLDQAEYAKLLHAAAKISGGCRDRILEMIRLEIDIVNALIVMRNVCTYHFDEERMSKICILGGTMPLESWLILTKESDVSGVIHGMPGDLRRLLQSMGAASIYKYENALWRFLYVKAIRNFYNFGVPSLGVMVFPYLLRFETLNLCRIYESVRFSIPSRVIREMMIDEIG